MAETSSNKSETSVLFVCLGNICRSPLAEAVFRNELAARNIDKVTKVDSCGTAAYHEGARPDSRSLAVLQKQGVKGYVHRARKIQLGDFEDFDWIFAMDKSNLHELRELRQSIAQERKTEDGLGKVMLFGTYSGSSQGEVVDDPYYGGDDGFDTAYEQVRRFSTNFILQELQESNQGPASKA